MQERDLAPAVALHLRALPTSFFSRLGPRFLCAYYRTYTGSPHAVALVATRGGSFCGFVVGASAVADHSAWTVRRHGARLAVAAGLAMTVRPHLAWWFLRTRLGRYARGLRRRWQHPRAGSPTGAAPSGQPAVLSHIAVDDRVRGSGAGAALVQAFLEATGRAGAAVVELVTLAGPDGAGGFYDRLGFEHVRDRTDPDGTGWSYYRIEVGPGGGPSEERRARTAP